MSVIGSDRAVVLRFVWFGFGSVWFFPIVHPPFPYYSINSGHSILSVWYAPADKTGTINGTTPHTARLVKNHRMFLAIPQALNAADNRHR